MPLICRWFNSRPLLFVACDSDGTEYRGKNAENHKDSVVLYSVQIHFLAFLLGIKKFIFLRCNQVLESHLA